MPRNMSFSITTNQIRERSKTITRRLGWWFLKPGEIVTACEKCMGLKKGEKVTKICTIRIVSTRKEKLYQIDKPDVTREGFPNMTPDDFIWMFCNHNKCTPETEVNRIEFDYVP